jgi:formate-dependent nitrite reductase membrane component NrfD
MPEHFAAPPNWEWWILAYFFFGGIAGGSYAIGTLIRLFGVAADGRAARTAFIVSFIALLPCPVFLTLDLGQPVRFVNMLLNASDGGISFKYLSPMSVGSWGLLGFGLFSFVSFLGALGEGPLPGLGAFARLLRGALGAAWTTVGTGLGFFVAGYTGVLLSVSNQPVWSDAGWVLGGLFLASALTGSTAILSILSRSRRDDPSTAIRLEAADRNFIVLEAILIVLFIASISVAGTMGKLLGMWGLLWIVVALGLAAPLVASRLGLARRWPAGAPLLALLGVLALRALVIFGAQS